MEGRVQGWHNVLCVTQSTMDLPVSVLNYLFSIFSVEVQCYPREGVTLCSLILWWCMRCSVLSVCCLEEPTRLITVHCTFMPPLCTPAGGYQRLFSDAQVPPIDGPITFVAPELPEETLLEVSLLFLSWLGFEAIFKFTLRTHGPELSVTWEKLCRKRSTVRAETSVGSIRFVSKQSTCSFES
jgi:hypothetical protein